MFKIKRRLTNPRSLAKAVREVVLAEEHYNQGLWINNKYFVVDGYNGGVDTRNMTATGAYLRYVFNENVCGTTSCVAGTAIILTLPAKAKYDYFIDEVILGDGRHVYAYRYAADALGITLDQGDWLFNADRSKSDVLEALDLLVKGKSIASLAGG